MQSRTYVVEITLVADRAIDLPGSQGAEDIIAAQMSGDLDDPTDPGDAGLLCSFVAVLKVEDD